MTAAPIFRFHACVFHSGSCHYRSGFLHVQGHCRVPFGNTLLPYDRMAAIRAGFSLGACLGDSPPACQCLKSILHIDCPRFLHDKGLFRNSAYAFYHYRATIHRTQVKRYALPGLSLNDPRYIGNVKGAQVNFVPFTYPEIEYPILSVRRRKYEGIGAGSAIQSVVAGATIQGVVADAAVQAIVTGTAKQGVIATLGPRRTGYRCRPVLPGGCRRHRRAGYRCSASQ